MPILSKSELRKQVKLLINQFSDEIKLKKSQDVSKNILKFLNKILSNKFPTYSSNGIIGGFAPLNDEVDWPVECSELGDRLAFPGTSKNGDMLFFHVSLDDLVETKVFGVTVKTPPLESKVIIPELLLIPGLAFGMNGERLGRGAGFYDKYLENFRGLKIGICTNEQLIERIPLESHDILMDGLITDSKILLFKRR